MKRPVIMFAVGAIALLATALPAAAHSEFQPGTTNVGATTKFNLFVEDEEPTAGTVKVELFFPTAIKVDAAAVPAGWTVTAQGGSVGSTATGLTWAGPALSDSANLKLTLGPFAQTTGRLQFKVLQTYDNGTVVRWIDTNPVGGPEPTSPGPVIDVLAKGVAAPTTTVDAGHDHSTETPAHDHGAETTVHDHAAAPHDATVTTAAPAKKSDSSNTGAIVGIIAAVVVLGGGLAFAVRSRKKP